MNSFLKAKPVAFFRKGFEGISGTKGKVMNMIIKTFNTSGIWPTLLRVSWIRHCMGYLLMMQIHKYEKKIWCFFFFFVVHYLIHLDTKVQNSSGRRCSLCFREREFRVPLGEVPRKTDSNKRRNGQCAKEFLETWTAATLRISHKQS